MTDHHWANTIRAGASDEDANYVIETINKITMHRRANRGSVMLACAQILAETIVTAPMEVKTEIRQGIITLIDDYAMRHALEERS